MNPIDHCISGWEYIEQSRREILKERGIPLPGENGWGSHVTYDFFEITGLTVRRRWDLFYDFEIDSYRETLNQKESEIASRADLAHEVRRSQIYLLRGGPYLQRMTVQEIAAVENQAIYSASSDRGIRATNFSRIVEARMELGFGELQTEFETSAARSSHLCPPRPTITDEDKIFAEQMGIALG